MSNNNIRKRASARKARVAPAIAPDLPLEDFVDEAETSKQLKIAEKTLKNWRHRGIGPPFFKFGPKMVRYTRQRNAAWAAGYLRTSTSQKEKATA
jgi:hypothetical protein